MFASGQFAGALALFCFFAVLPLCLLARVSHWAYATQAKLDTTNALLRQLLAERETQTEEAAPIERARRAKRSA